MGKLTLRFINFIKNAQSRGNFSKREQNIKFKGFPTLLQASSIDLSIKELYLRKNNISDLR